MWLTGRNPKLDMWFLYVDYLRIYELARRIPTKNSGRGAYLDIMKTKGRADMKAARNEKAKSEIDAFEADHDSDLVLRNVSKINRASYVLNKKYGWPLKEIGKLFGVSESRACMFVREAKGKLK